MNYEEVQKKLIEKGVKLSSAKVYVSKFKRIINEIHKNILNYPVFKLDWLITDFQDYPMYYTNNVLEFVNKPEITVNEKDNLLKGFIKCLEALDIDTKVYLEKFQPILTDLKYDKEFQEPSEKEEENKLSKADLIKLRDEWKGKLTDKFTKFDLYYVLLSLYTYMQPLRSQDYVNSFLSIIERKDLLEGKQNHISLETKKLYLFDYKTVSCYGTRIIDLPNELIQILKEFKEKSSSQYVICSPKGNKLEANSFNRLFHEATKGKQFSCNMARKCFVSEGIEKPIAERKADARVMAHSMSTAAARYSKLSKSFHADDDDLDALIDQMRVLNKLRDDLNKKIMSKLSTVV